VHDLNRRPSCDPAAVVANGGTIVYDEVEIPTVGRLVQFLDTEQNIVSAMHYEPGVLR
jgi:predicted enzyme related to lactoylglutathione lyase